MRLENTWQEIRDHSFIQNLSRSFRFTAPWRCFFSSVHLTLFLQGSGQRTGMASRSLVLCSVTHFCVVFEVCVWIVVRLEDPNMAHYKISNRVSHFLIFLSVVFDRIHDAMCLNKMSRTSSRNIGPQHQKYSSIFYCTHGVLFYPWVHQTHLECLLLKSSFFLFHLTIEASPVWSSSRVWQLNMLEFVFGWVRRIFLETLPNNMWWCRCCLTIFLKRFSDPET